MGCWGAGAKERMQGAVSALEADRPPSPPETLLSKGREDVAVEKGARATEALKDPGDLCTFEKQGEGTSGQTENEKL